MRYRLLLLLLPVLLSLSCNKDESITPLDPGTGTNTTVLITAPSGGEIYKVGESKAIRWTSNTANRLKLEYTTDGGSSWLVITESTGNSGLFSWTVPNTLSGRCLVKITDVTDQSVADVSDNFFSIIPNVTKTLTVTKPNGGETLITGSSYRIEWSSSNVANVKIEYSTNNGTLWSTIIASTPGDSGYYVWSSVPNANSSQCKVRVSDAADTIKDESNTAFTITTNKSLQLRKPNGGEQLTVGTPYRIQWVSSNVQAVKIEYSTNNGSNWQPVINRTDSSGAYTWTVPGTVSAQCLVRLTDADDNTVTDMSDGVFSISTLPTIQVTAPNGGEIWYSGETKVISWNSASAESKARTRTEEVTASPAAPSAFVKIEYSTDGGSTWATLTNRLANSGSYTTIVPAVNSNRCRVRVSDADNGTPSDVSDADFTIAPPVVRTLALVQPVGGEQWDANSSRVIQWVAVNVDNIRIELSTDGGSNWGTIISGVNASSGVYPWRVSNTPSAACRIRIVDLLHNTVRDSSRNTFTILPAQLVAVTKPNGGEIVTAGGAYNIQWASTNLSQVKLQYTTNNGVTWSLITASTESDGFYTWSPVPQVLSANCRIKISDAADDFPADSSDAVFSILAEPVLKVTYPNGGERLLAGSSATITWNTITTAGRITRGEAVLEDAPADFGVSNVKLELTTDGGANWSIITSSTSNTGSYAWNTVPSINSALCKIRVSDADDGYPVDQSDSAFVIYNQLTQLLTVTAPNGGEVLTAGNSYAITWQSTGISAVNIDFTTNNGVSWSSIVRNTESDGYYLWPSIPNLSSTNCKVRIADAADSIPSDESNAAFSISPSPSLTVLSPNGLENYLAGTTQNITWTSQNVASVKLEFSTNNGGSWAVIADSTESDGFYAWVIPAVNSALCRVRITNRVNFTPADISDSNFTITTQAPQSLSLISPNGGTTLTGGTAQNIIWTSTGIDSVKLELTTNNGVSWTTITAKVPSNGLYAWSPVPSINSANCKIRVSDAADGTPSDISDNVFTIITEPVLKVTSPNGGNRILAGSASTITWTTTGLSAGIEGTDDIATVKLELSTDGGNTFTAISNSVPNSGTFNWDPVPNVSSALCRVRVSDAVDGVPSDISDSNFVIFTQLPQTVTVTSPNGGDILQAGGSTDIRWNSSGIANVMIEFSTNNGVNWSTVVASTESDGFYTWSPVPAVASTNCKIRISDAADNTPADESDATFTILPAPAITVLGPNGGENFVSGNQTDITWNSSNISAVKIELTTNNGAGWSTITDSTESDGIYTWTIPALNSSLCKIRVSNKAGGLPVDESNSVFTITNQIPQSITVISPNGGEQLTSGTARTLNWTSSNVDTVKIEYTTNNGVSWTTVVNKTPSNGSFSWSVPAVNSNNCKIRISDAADGQPSDASDNVFSIAVEPVIAVTSPNGGERILAGSGSTITWTTTIAKAGDNITDVPNVKIEFSSDGGATWGTLANSVTNSGSFNWNPVPSVSSALCRVRVSDAIDGVPADISDSNFTIYTTIPQSVTVTAPNGGEVITAGSSTSITWSSTGISLVKLEYSTNNGVSWNTIIASTESNGFYQWSPVPNTTSTNCKVRVSDASDGTPADESNSTFTILPAPAISVTAPNGGESYVSGTQQQITWTSSNIAAVKIELTTNSGASWSSVTDSTASTGTYTWTVPSVNSALCRIRLSNQAGGVPSDESNANFSISSSQPQSITVVSPNGGEQFTAGTRRTISWTSSNVDTVKIEYSTNNGVSWSTIVNKTPSNGSYSWSVPAVNSNNCKVRISDAADGSPADASDNVFSVSVEPVLTVTSPNGGERILAGSGSTISWTTNYGKSGDNIADLPNVKIEFSSDGGATWSTLTNSVTNSGSFNWNPVPSVSSALCRVRISDAVDGLPSDISDSNFTIYTTVPQSVSVTSPNGGEVLTAGSSSSITWSSIGISSVKLEYTTNNGVSWVTITASTESNGFYQWSPVPTVSSTNCKIRVSDASDGTPADESNGTFTILPAPAITLTAPNGGESLVAATVQQITWTSSNIAAVKIELTTNSGASWSSISDSTGSTGSYSWTVPSANSSLCRIRISNQAGGVPSDESNANFSISSSLPQSITVVSPNGGEQLTAGTRRTISWTSSNVDTVKIEYSTNNGVSWTTVVNKTPSNGSYSWSVPSVNSNNCKVRISDATDGEPSDASDAVFSIAVEPVMAITSPNGGERILAGSGSTITWTTNYGKSGDNIADVPNVKIEFSSDGGGTWGTLANSITNNGTFNWNPVPSVSSALCRVRVSDAVDGLPSDISDSNFTIYTTVPQSVNITSPNGGELLTAGGTTSITWSSIGISSVKLEYTTNNGVSWTTITASTESNGFYQWSPIPTVSSTNCKIRVSDAADGSPSDESDLSFTILPAPAISLTSPNGGENYVAGTLQAITWSSSNITAVKIELTTNSGASWSSITDSTASTGSYNWTVPSVNSTLCRVRVSNQAGGVPSDESNTNFSIATSAAQSVSVLSPNGGEQFTGATIRVISWRSSTIDTVKIEYSTNNGVSWSTVVNKTASNGSYNWSVPAVVSNNCLVRISDANDGSPSDVSDGVFSITVEPVIRVTAPNGGERLQAGSNSTITWSTTYSKRGDNITDVPTVKLEVSFDEGSTWTVLAAAAANTGSYIWSPVPSVNSSICRVRVSDAADGVPVDVSDSNFTIFTTTQRTVALSSPNGGESLSSGTVQFIRWTSANITAVKLELSNNNGASWSSITDSTESDGVYAWTVPALNSALCKVRVSNQSTGAPYDESDNVFSISTVAAQSLTVTSPNGGEVWAAGSAQRITWSSTSVDSVKIEYSINGGQNWSTVVAKTESDGFYLWTAVPTVSSTNCIIRISDAADGEPFDVSNAAFTISPEPYVSVIAPNSIETLTQGSTYDIRWASENLANVMIELTTNNGASWSTITASTSSDGSYLWTVPAVSSSLCKIRISDPADGLPSDVSDTLFTINNVSNQAVTVLTPNGTEVWEAGTSQLITWTATGIDKIKLEFTTNNGISWTTITDSTESDGLYEWTVPAGISSSLCKVRASDYSDFSPADESNAVFTITPTSSLRLTYPNGGETLTAGQAITITWSSSNVTSVAIDYFYEGLEDWVNIISSTPSDGSFEWSPPVAANTYRLRIRNAGSSSPSDESDGTFIVLPIPYVQVQSPNTPVVLQAGSNYDITWYSVNLRKVKIELTTNNGSSWTAVSDSTENDGVHTWTVPAVSSSLCKIRISDLDGVPTDMSDTTFTITSSGVQSVTVLSPNGGDDLPLGSSATLTWNSTGIDSVKIELSTNNGVSWTTLVATTPSLGIYVWNPVTATASTNCLIRISDAADGFPSDESNATFTISSEPAISVITPNGGEQWISGSQQILRWTSTNVANVTIELSSNNGATWSSVASNIPSTGQYTWPSIPAVNSNQCRIRIKDAADGNPFDLSDNNFAIVNAKQIRVTFPNGGEYITQDTTFIWTAFGVDTVNLEVTYDNGATGWTTLASGIPNTGAYRYTLPAVRSSLARFRVTYPADTTIRDMSDATFNVGFPAPPLRITLNPEGIKTGRLESITVESDREFKNAILEYSEPGSASWTPFPDPVVIHRGKQDTGFTLPNDLGLTRIVLRLRVPELGEIYRTEPVSVDN